MKVKIVLKIKRVVIKFKMFLRRHKGALLNRLFYCESSWRKTKYQLRKRVILVFHWSKVVVASTGLVDILTSICICKQDECPCVAKPANSIG